MSLYVRVGGYGVVHHLVSDACRQTPGHEPQRLTVCGRVVKDSDEVVKDTPWPLCSVCARVGRMG